MKKLFISLVIMLLAGVNIMAADRYWVGGAGNWNDASKWSSASGGPGGAGVPTADDNVFFDASSFTADSRTVTINTNAVCADMSWVGAQHTPILQRDGTTTRTLSIYGSLTLIEQMDFNFLGVVYFESAFVGKTITSAGQSFKNHVYFQGEGGYVLQDNFTQINNFIVHFVRGSLNLNDKDFNVNSFSSNYTNVRVLNFGSSIITISFGANNTVNAFILNGTNLDFTSGTSLLRFTGNNFQFTATGGLVFNEMVSESAIGTSRILSTNGIFKKITINNTGILNNKNTIDTLIFNGIGTINNDNNIIGLLTANQTLTINNNNGSYGHVSINGNGNLNGTNNTYGTLVLTPGKLYTFRHGNTHIIGDVLTANGNCGEPIIFQSSSSGNQATIRKASGSIIISYCMLQDMNTDGTATFTANNSIDLGNNTGWTINEPTPLSFYWRGESGNWNDPANWRDEHGNPTSCVPSQFDNVFFDALSFSGAVKTVTVTGDANSSIYCNNLDWTGVTGNHKITSGTGQNLYIHGSLTLVSGMDWDFNGNAYFKGKDTGKPAYSITSAGQSFKRGVFFQGNGTYELNDNFTITGNYNVGLDNGGLILNNITLTARRFLSNATSSRTLTLGNSVIILSYSDGSNNASEINASNLLFNGGSTLFRFTGGSAGFLVTNGNLSFHNVNFEGATNGRLNAANCTFNTVTFNNVATISGGNVTIGSVTANGNATINGNNNNITTLVAGGTATINNNNGYYGHVTLNGNGILNGSGNTYGTLIFKPGNLYKFLSGQTHYITNDWFANGTEEQQITIEASTTTQTTISKASGSNVVVEWVKLKYNKAVGGSGITFTANNSFDEGNNEGWTINAPGGRDLFWVGGTGNWNDASNWSEESNGTGGVGIPSLHDNVFFDEYSFSGTGQTVTVIGDATNDAYCRNMDWTGVAGNHKIVALNTSQKLNIYGSLVLAEGMVWDFGGEVYFKGEDTMKSSYDITTAGQSFKRGVFFQGNGTYELNDDFTINGNYSVVLDNGVLILNNITLTAWRFLSTATSSRTLNLGNSVVILSYSDGSNHALDINASNFQVTGGTSLFRLTGAQAGFRVTNGNHTFHNVNFEGSAGRLNAANCTFNTVANSASNGSATISGGSVTINTLTTTGNATIGGNNNNITTLVAGGTATINNNNGYYGHVTLNGNGILNGSGNTYGTLIFKPGNLYKFLSGQTHYITNDWFANGTEEQQITIEASTTTQTTISKASGSNVVVEWVKLKYNKAVGGSGITFTANNSFDEGNNEGWTINAPGGRDLFWVGGTGNWNDASNWSEESNGTGGVGIPSLHDNVFFDEYSFSGTGQTVTVIGDATNDAYCRNMDWTGVAGNHKIVALNTSQKLNIYGSLVLAEGMVWDFGGEVYFKGEDTMKSSYDITTAGQSFKRGVFFQGNGTYELNDDFTINGNYSVVLDNGVLILNNITLTAWRFLSTATSSRTLNLGNSVVILSYSDGSNHALDINASNFQVTGGTSLFRLTGAQAGFRVTNGNHTFHNVNFEGSAGRLNAANCTFNTVANSASNGSATISGGSVTINTLTTTGNATIGGNNNNITTLVAGGTATINNDNGNYNHATLQGNGTITGSNTFGTLILTAGKTYTITHSKILTILTDLVAEGTCAEPMTIQSSSTTLQTTIHKSAGTVTVTRAFMQGLIASGGALFEAINSVDMDNSNTGWDFIVVPENLYWVGGSGNWSDVNKWSHESGGAVGYCVPSRLDNVIFDANSFFQEAQFVQIDITNAECYNMDWTGVQFVPTFMGAQANNLSIYGSLTFSPNMNFTFAGNVYFEGKSAAKSAYNIISSGKSFNRHVYFNGVGGEWNLLDDFSAGNNNIYLQHGTLNTNGKAINCGSFISNNTNTRALNMGASVFTLSSSSNEAWLVNSPSLALSSGSSEIIFTAAGGGFRSYGANILSYNKITFQNAGGTSIHRSNHQFAEVVFNPVGSIRDGGTYGNVTMNRGGDLQNNSAYNGTVKLYGNTLITGTNNFARLLLGPGNTFTFPHGQTQTISGRFIIWGSAANPITIQSSASGTRATISKSAGTVLGNYIHIKDMAATGGATFNLYSSVDNGNNIGWNFLDPTYEDLAGITISDQETECWEATEIITVGGTDHFTVQNGGSATLIAGYKIELLPGTRVFSGGRLHAYITPYGFFCDTITTMLASDFVEEVAKEQFPTVLKEGLFFNIFPNPTTGLFTLELKEFDEFSAITVEISSMLGERIIRQELPAAVQYQIDISRHQPGIYMVRVIQGKEAGVLKVVRR